MKVRMLKALLDGANDEASVMFVERYEVDGFIYRRWSETKAVERYDDEVIVFADAIAPPTAADARATDGAGRKRRKKRSAISRVHGPGFR